MSSQHSESERLNGGSLFLVIVPVPFFAISRMALFRLYSSEYDWTMLFKGSENVELTDIQANTLGKLFG